MHTPPPPPLTSRSLADVGEVGGEVQDSGKLPLNGVGQEVQESGLVVCRPQAL